MKKNYSKLLTLAAVGAFSLNVIADPVADLMRSGVSDINTLANVQLKPIGNSIAAGLGSGWYNTAKPHKILGLDLTLTINMAAIPSEEKLFDFSKQGFTALQLANPNADKMMPTLIAPDNITGADLKIVFPKSEFVFSGQDATKFINGYNLYNQLNPNKPLVLPENTSIVNGKLVYSLPQQDAGKPVQLKGLIPSWVPIIAFPVPMVNLGIGLPLGSEIDVRYLKVPTMSGFDMSMWGLAFKHDFKQWLPVVKDLPIDASILFGYTKLSSSYAISVLPQSYGDVLDLSTNNIWGGQKMSLGASAFTTNIIVSKSLLFFTPYIGFGFTSTSFDLAMEGNYPLIKAPVTQQGAAGYVSPFIIPTATEIANGKNIEINKAAFKPVVDDKIEAKKQADGTYSSGDYMKDPIKINPTMFMPNATIGFRLKLLILTIHAQYTIQKYPTYTAGFGLSFR